MSADPTQIGKRFLDLFGHHFHGHLLLRRATFDSKIFCIGYNKTGTTSVGRSIEALGFRHSSFNKRVWRNYYQRGRIDKILRYTAKFDSFDDLPWLKEDMIPILDQSFPHSKFIFLERDEDDWVESYQSWRQVRFGQDAQMKNELAKFQEHRRFVLDYFQNRPDSEFLRLDVQDPMGLRKLATFLGKRASQDSFPRLNETKNLKPRLAPKAKLVRDD